MHQIPRNTIQIIFLIFTLSSCTSEYWDYHAKKASQTSTNATIVRESKEWSPESLEDRDLEILSTPDTKTLDRLVSFIDGAKREILVEVYILTEKRIIKALQDAKKRGVAVRVILEKNVFGATSINSKAFKSLQSAGIEVVYASNKLYNFTHSKLLIADDTYLVTTGNFSHSSFTSNREWYVIGKHPDDLATLREIFDRDFRHETWSGLPFNLVISPINSRTRLEKTLSFAGSGILLYAQTFGDPAITDILAKETSEHVKTIICIADPKKIPSNREAIEKLRSLGADVRTSKKPIIHAKAFLVDGIYAYIGSENYTTNSLDNNREIGILFRSDQEFSKRFTETFYADCPK